MIIHPIRMNGLVIGVPQTFNYFNKMQERINDFIIRTSETDTMMMYPKIHISSYIFSALITILFTVIVMILMHVKLRKVNMIDALKSNE